VVSQFVRDMSVAESVVFEAGTHRDSDSEAANVSTAKATNMSNAKGAAKPSDLTASILKRTAR
jgi:hypothetical protein